MELAIEVNLVRCTDKITLAHNSYQARTLLSAELEGCCPYFIAREFPKRTNDFIHLGTCKECPLSSFSPLSHIFRTNLLQALEMGAWTAAEIYTLRKTWREKTDREIANLLGRSLYSVRSFRVRNVIRRRAGHRDRWKGASGRSLSRLIATEYKRGSSQTDLVNKYRLEWRKLKEILVSSNLQIRDKSQQILVQRYGRLPRIRSRLSASKLYVIFAMLGDNLRPSDQTKWRTHIIGIAAGSDTDFARDWIENFRREYGIRPRLLRKGKNNIQAYISSVDIWCDLHRYAVFGSRKWRLKPWLMRFLMKRVPLRVLGYGLRGFFDAEGSFVSRSKRKTSGTVNAGSVNYRGLKQISHLLERLGISHRFHKQYVNTVSISGRANLETYLELVGFGIQRKREGLEMTVMAAKRPARVKLNSGERTNIS